MNDFGHLFQGAADGMLVHDAARRITHANAAAERLVGCAAGGLIGRDVTELLPALSASAAAAPTRGFAAEGAVRAMHPMRRDDGGELLVDAVVTRISDDVVLTVLRDTPNGGAANALSAAQARFEAVASHLNAALSITDADGRAVYVNQEMCVMTGYASHELLGAELGALLLGPDDQRRLLRRHDARRNGQSERYEVTHRRRDGSTYLVEVSASPLTDGAGQFIGTVGVATDVTFRAVREEMLAAREERYRGLYEASPIPSFVYDSATRRFLSVNPAMVLHYGYSEQAFVDMRLDDIHLPEEVEKLLRHVRSSDEFDVVRGFRHRSADGAVFPVEVVTHAMEFDERAARIAVVYDVSERERMREQQDAVAGQLQQAQKMEAVGRLAGGVAHDFNNLLSVVLGAAEHLDVELPAWSPLRDDVRDVRDAAQRGAALTRQLLALGRRETRVARVIDLNAVVADAERLLVRALGRGVVLSVACSAEPLYAVADPSQVEQSIVNLAFNARDAMPSGGRLMLSTRAVVLGQEDAEALGVKAGRYVCLAMQDTGAGMDEATRERAFEPFFSTKPRSNGSGLGLSAVYGIAKQSHGAVLLESALGAGTTVTFYLPQADGASGALAERDGGEGVAARARGRLLLVEDEAVVRAQTARLLRRSGYTVDEAEHGAAGVVLFEAHPEAYDAIVSDVMMPVLNGGEMVARLRAGRPSVPVVFVSGYAAEDVALEFDARTRFIAKPFKIAELCEAIDLLIGRRAD